ncbi:MAG: lipopolysaccharide heptosyltransferase II [Bacteroidetes bacterium]|nr:lipopolysaccharide heptosyltransferase II [Bacteroidota bacterium]
MNLIGNEKILVIQTAYLGDLAMTLPMIQLLKKNKPKVTIDIICLPDTSKLIENNIYLNQVIVYDKRKTERGLIATLKLIKRLKKNNYDCAIIPHPSVRSALIGLLSKIKIRIGFEKSAGKILFTNILSFNNYQHEIERNISLLSELNIFPIKKETSEYFPSDKEKLTIEKIISENISKSIGIITIAPGSVWNTKRWMPERFAEVVNNLIQKNYLVFAIGAESDKSIGDKISKNISSSKFINLIGKLSLLESIELIKKSTLLISNDSGPLHISSGVNTPVVGIYGPTDPKFGFWPYGANDEIIETNNLECRPCGMHGGDKCPIGTWECMEKITPQKVLIGVEKILLKK